MSKAIENKTGMHPINNRVMVRLNSKKEEMIGGIYIPDASREIPDEGYIIELGTQNVNVSTGLSIPWNVKVGQKILIQRHAGYSQTHENNKYLFILEGDIIAAID